MPEMPRTSCQGPPSFHGQLHGNGLTHLGCSRNCRQECIFLPEMPYVNCNKAPAAALLLLRTRGSYLGSSLCDRKRPVSMQEVQYPGPCRKMSEKYPLHIRWNSLLEQILILCAVILLFCSFCFCRSALRQTKIFFSGSRRMRIFTSTGRVLPWDTAINTGRRSGSATP